MIVLTDTVIQFSRNLNWYRNFGEQFGKISFQSIDILEIHPTGKYVCIHKYKNIAITIVSLFLKQNV